MEKKSDFGLIGLAVMGQNLVLNVESRGFQVSVYNRTSSKMTEFIAENPGRALVGCESLEEFVESLATPTQNSDHGAGWRASRCCYQISHASSRS